MAIWRVQDAKTRLSKLIEEANTKGPQIITRHGAERAVVLSIAEYKSLTSPKSDLQALLLAGPKLDDFDVTREPDIGREIAW